MVNCKYYALDGIACGCDARIKLTPLPHKPTMPVLNHCACMGEQKYLCPWYSDEY